MDTVANMMLLKDTVAKGYLIGCCERPHVFQDLFK